MRFARTLGWSITRETLQYAALGFAAITALLVSQHLLQRLESWTQAGFTAGDFATALRCLAPMLTAYSLPAAFLLGVMVTTRRLSSDSETLAMQSCGLGLSAVLVPILAIASVAATVSGVLALGVEHESRREILALVKTVAARRGVLESGIFRELGHRTIYVRERSRDNELRGVVIDDRSAADGGFTVFAERGVFSLDEESGIAHLRLGRGDLHPHPDPENLARTARVSFDALEYRLDLGVLLRGIHDPTRPKQMSWSELRDVVRRAERGESLEHLDEHNPTQYALEMQRRLAAPATPLVFALIGVPLGLRRARGARALGVALCAGLVGAYYGLLTFAQFLASEHWLSPAAAHWGPNLLVALCAWPLLRRAARGFDS